MIAVTVVILDHLIRWPSGGFVGVDVFFVISGFLITGLLLREHDRTGTISFWGFYRRRIKRILPAATLVVIVTIVASWFLLSRARAVQTFWDGVWASFFAANWHYALGGTDYFQPDTAVSPLQHYWSLSVEEQFYFVWPWLMLGIFWLVARGVRSMHVEPRVAVGVAIIAITAASFVWSVWETSASPTWAYFSTLSRTWELGVGATIAIAASVFTRLPMVLRPVLGWLGLAGIVLSLVVVTPTVAFPGPWALLPVLSTALVIIAGTGGRQRFMWPIMNPVSSYVGDASYSLYLWHWPIIVFAAAYFPLTEPIPLAATAIAIVVVSLASFHLVENPIRKSRWLEPRSETPRHDSHVRHLGLPAKAVGLATTSIVAVLMTTWALVPQAPVQAIADEPAHVVFLGDSYTVGTGSDGPAWPDLVGAALGWSVVNLAAGGTGYATEAGVDGCGREHCGTYDEESAKITAPPTAIIVSGGRNDPSEQVAAAAGDLFADLSTRYPDATIVALSPWTDDDPATPALGATIDAVAEAAKSAGVVYVDTGQPFEGKPDLISADGVHPNDAGYRQLANTLIPLLGPVVPGSGAPSASGGGETTALGARVAQLQEALRATEWPELVPAVDVLGTAARVPEWVDDKCLDVDATSADRCVYGAADAASGIALLGDSHAISYMPTLREAFGDQRIQSLTLQQCPAVPVEVELRTSQGRSGYPECTAHQEWALQWVAEHRPDTVVIVDTWDTPSRMPGDDDEAKLEQYRLKLTETIRSLSASTSRIILLASPPPGLNLVDCKTPLSSPADCARSAPRAYAPWITALKTAVADAATDSAQLVETEPWFCVSGRCPAFVGTTALYADGNHLTDASARALAPLLLDALG